MRNEKRIIPGQTWEADRYVKNANFVPELGKTVLDMLEAKSGERILDLACGDGALTEKIADLGATVVGIDSSEDMVAAATRRGVDASVRNAYELEFDRKFDAVFSNAALHWMKYDPDLVIAGVANALKSHGRFVAEMGGYGNIAAITVGLLATLERRGIANPASLIPWYFPTAQAYRAKLEAGSFLVRYIELIPRPTPLPTGMEGWIKTFAMTFIRSLPESEQDAAIAETVERLRPVLCDEKGCWTADYVRLRFVAQLIQ
ncbi:MAG: class I SAM-dependent methyltransferase [Terriglobales bacterium]